MRKNEKIRALNDIKKVLYNCQPGMNNIEIIEKVEKSLNMKSFMYDYDWEEPYLLPLVSYETGHMKLVGLTVVHCLNDNGTIYAYNRYIYFPENWKYIPVLASL